MTRVDMKNLDIKKIATAAAIAGALGFSALGLGAGMANAGPATLKTAPTVWSQDDGDGWGWHGHGGRGHWGGPGWDPGWGPGWGGWGGPCATGAIGWASGQVCL